MSSFAKSNRPSFSPSLAFRILFVAIVFFVCFVGVQTTRAQSALDGFDPNANGTIWVVVVQPDGKILIGGNFTTLSPNGGGVVTRNRIARLNPDGTLDAAFDPNSNGFVYSIALQSDGKILVGGAFSGAASIGGQTRNHIARLDAVTGAADTTFNPNANDYVFAITVQSDGKILAGGLFNGAGSIGGQARNRIARLDAAGVPDSFNPNASSTVRTIAVQSDGKVLVGGFFNGANSIGGQPRNFIARLDATSGSADSFNPNANNQVLSFAIQPDGKIVVGGLFNGPASIGGQARNRIARLDTTGAVDTFDPSANGDVDTVVRQLDGKILASGIFTSIGGQTRNRIARLDPVTGLADSFDPNANNEIISVAVQQDGNILAGGLFGGAGSIGGQTRNNIARLERNGTLDQTLNLSLVGSNVRATAVQPDGKLLIGGLFTSVLGTTRNNIARLNSDGTLDVTFNPNATGGDVFSIVVLADGKVLVSGAFTNIGGQPRNRVARLDGTTGVADTFDPNANGDVDALEVQPDGRILIGGAFLTLSPNGGVAVARNRIARVNSDGSLDSGFNPSADNTVFTIGIQSDGRVLAGGQFINIGGQPRNRIARLDTTTGAADLTFNPNADDLVNLIAVQSNGRAVAGGQFASIGLQSRSRIARLDASSGAPDAFDPNATGPILLVDTVALQSDGKVLFGGRYTGANATPRNNIARVDGTNGAADSYDPNATAIGFPVYVLGIVVHADGKVTAGGNFTTIGGQPRNKLARLTNDTAALQTLTATSSTITWTRNGAAPHLFRATFELSINGGATYTPLGNATTSLAGLRPETANGSSKTLAPNAPLTSGYTLTGLNLPTAQIIYIRARGFYRGGYQDNSESITELVLNTFINAPAAAAVSVSGRVLTSDGNGLRNAIVTMTDEQGIARMAITSAFGYYRFDDVTVGRTYILAVGSKRFSYASLVINLSDDLADIDFTAQE